jgi:hypothetical protein
MANGLDEIIFGKKKFSDLLKEIYDNQNKKKLQINTLIQELQPLMKTISDATLLVPLIKEYLEISVKNDEQLVKLATVIQRIVSGKSGGGEDLGLTENERKQIMDEIKQIEEKN